MPPRSPKQIFELFFTPRFPLYFLLGALALGLAVNMLSDLAKHYLAPNGEPWRLVLIMALAVGSLGVLVALAYSAGAIQTRAVGRAGNRFIDRPHPRPARGLIASVSLNQNEHIRKAIVYHGKTLERVWLIATADAEPWAAELKAEFETEKCRISIEHLSDEYELKKASEAVEHIFRSQFGELPEEEIVADITAGTKSMTVGMIIACVNARCNLQFVPTIYEGGKATVPFDPIEFSIGYDLSGRVM